MEILKALLDAKEAADRDYEDAYDRRKAGQDLPACDRIALDIEYHKALRAATLARFAYEDGLSDYASKREVPA